MRQRALPADLQLRTLNYLHFLWGSSGGVDPNDVLSRLPFGLRLDVLLHMCGSMVRAVPIFKHMDDKFIERCVCRCAALRCAAPQPYTAWHGCRWRRLISRLTFSYYPAGEFILHKGDIGQEMFFVSKGEVDIVLD